MAKRPKKRLDVLLVERGLAASLDEAGRIAMAGEVFCGTERLTKPGVAYPEDVELESRRPSPWASRGALKLLAALDAWPDLAVEGRACLDLGASTGGFTHALVERGARLVWAVDVGRGLLHEKLRDDPRVRSMEGANARSLSPGAFAEAPPSLLVADLSFISLRAVAPAGLGLLAPESGDHGRRPEAILLMKPQFEAPASEVAKGGVVRDEAVHRRLLDEFAAWEPAPGWRMEAWLESPIKGPAGNREYLLHFSRRADNQSSVADVE
jgi:23S rRNA (cytidine1920-2'-O)/16S rRNA (cytidine1409-2'-O)-methyltransferase